MLPYFSVLAILVSCSFGSVVYPKQHHVYSVVCLLLLIAFAGLRYKTGYDWLAYDEYYDGVKPLWDSGANLICTTRGRYSFEIFYLWINVALKTISDSSVILYLVSSLVTISVVHYVVGRISKSQPIVWMTYFGILFLAAQMSLVRQGLADSIVLLSLLFASRGNRLTGGLVGLLSLGIQVSSLMFAPFFFLMKWRPSAAFVFSTLIIGSVAAGLQLDASKWILLGLSQIAPSWVGAKLEIYAIAPTANISMSSIALIILHMVALLFIYVASSEQEKSDSVINAGIWLIFGLLLCHLVIWNRPIIWNRLMIVALPWEIATIFRLSIWDRWRVSIKLSTISFLALVSGSSLFYMLAKPEMAAFVPYYSILSAGENIDYESRYNAGIPQVPPDAVQSESNEIVPASEGMCTQFELSR